MRLVTFIDNRFDQLEFIRYKNSCEKLGWNFHTLKSKNNWSCNALKLKLLKDFLVTLKDDETLFCTDAFDVAIFGSPKAVERKFNDFKVDILFCAEANFYFKDKDLKYFYWKHYPRRESIYHYLNSGLFIGRVGALKSMFREIEIQYGLNIENNAALELCRSDQYIYSRFYCDIYHQAFEFPHSVDLDYKHSLLGCTGGRTSAIKNSSKGEIANFLQFRYERSLIRFYKLDAYQDKISDYQIKDGLPYNSLTQSHPLALHIPTSRKLFSKRIESLIAPAKASQLTPRRIFAIGIALTSRIQAHLALLNIQRLNKNHLDNHQIFRFSNNANSLYQNSFDKLLLMLRNRVPFSFAHFNDGEIRFIESYLDGVSLEYEFGRKQNRYSYSLGEKLHKAITSSRENYYIGTPCSTCHPKLSSITKSLLKPDPQMLPAMVIHHNQSQLPKFLYALRERKILRIMNDGQSDLVLQKLGLTISDESRIIVPFRNAHLHYEKLVNIDIVPGTVVLMTCGMLGKLLAYELYKKHPLCTFITLGSALDDLIQKKYSNFKLFPKRFPFARIQRGKSFSFGYKKPCSECHEMSSK